MILKLLQIRQQREDGIQPFSYIFFKNKPNNHLKIMSIFSLVY